jgi:hypothetical protein
MNATNYGEQQWLNLMFGQISFGGGGPVSSGPANFYVGLLTNTSMADGTTPTEPDPAEDYNRVAIANNKTTGWNDAVDTGGGVWEVTNKNNIVFPQAKIAGLGGLGWADVFYVGIFDTATPATGNLIAWGLLTGATPPTLGVTVSAGTQMTINAGDLAFRLD